MTVIKLVALGTGLTKPTGKMPGEAKIGVKCEVVVKIATMLPVCGNLKMIHLK